ncbi:MAG: hypothetical protein ORN26_00200 [Candidatus Pacebacteria bacterium]|nr:hypothetical protein [Candidatus Paceibacterota bacterium]
MSNLRIIYYGVLGVLSFVGDDVLSGVVSGLADGVLSGGGDDGVGVEVALLVEVALSLELLSVLFVVVAVVVLLLTIGVTLLLLNIDFNVVSFIQVSPIHNLSVVNFFTYASSVYNLFEDNLSIIISVELAKKLETLSLSSDTAFMV